MSPKQRLRREKRLAWVGLGFTGLMLLAFFLALAQ